VSEGSKQRLCVCTVLVANSPSLVALLPSRSSDLDSNGTGRYIFKVCGYLDYLLHNDFKIGSFDHILHCQRKAMKIELELVKLSPADQMDLGPILGTTLEEEEREEEKKMEEHTDMWKTHRNERHRTIKKMPQQLWQRDSKWPFRCLVRGIQGCPGEELNVKSLYIEIGLYYNGTLIGPTESGSRAASPNTQPIDALKTSHVPYSNEPTWPGAWLSSTKHEVSLLPPSTRVGFMLYGVQPGGKSVPVAGVCVTLVDFQNIVLTGEKVRRSEERGAKDGKSVATTVYCIALQLTTFLLFASLIAVPEALASPEAPGGQGARARQPQIREDAPSSKCCHWGCRRKSNQRCRDPPRGV